MVAAGGSALKAAPRGARSSEIGMLRLAAQRVIGEPAGTPREAVRHLTALQAQDAPGALTSVALRTATRSRDEVMQAFTAGEIVKSWPMRGTLHLVAAEDLAWMLPVLTPRVISGARKRHADLEISERDFEHTREVTVGLLTGGRSVTRDQLFEAWERAGQRTTAQRGYHLLWWLAQTGTVVFGPMSEGEHLIVLLAEWAPSSRLLSPAEARAELALRYFRGHGPAPLTDLVAWARLSLTEARAAVAAARPHLETMMRDGEELYLDPATPEILARFRREAAGVVLLPGFDEFVLGYRNRIDILTPEQFDRVVPGGNGMFRATIVSAGRVVGTWRKGRPGPDPDFFDPPSATTRKAFDRAVTALP